HNSLTKLRLITLNYEKSRARDHRNKNLFVYITSKYIELHEFYQNKEISMPFAFEELVFRRVILLDPKNPMAHNNLADLYANQNVQLKEALKEAKIAHQLDNNNPYIMDTLGYCYYKNQKFEKSVQILNKAIEIDDSQAIIYFHLASAYYDLKKFDLAVLNFKKSVELDPNNSLTLNNLAYLYSELNQNLEEALTMCKIALKVAPKNPAYLDTLGWIYYQLGRYEEAKIILEKVLILDPKSQESKSHLEAILAKLNPEDSTKEILAPIPMIKSSLQSPPSSSKGAYDLLYKSIIQAKDQYIKNNQNQVSKSELKIFYDQLISLSSSQGDYIKLYQFMKEFENLNIQASDLNKSPQKSKTSTNHLKNSFYNFFPREPQLFIHAKHKALVKVYTKAFEYWSKSSPLDLKLVDVQDQITRELPQQIAISLYKPNEDTKLQILACSQMNKEKLQMIHRNLEMFAGRPLQIPGVDNIQLEIASIDSHTYQIKVFGVSVFISLQDQYLLVSNSLIATKKLPRKAQNSLNSNVKFLNYLHSAKDFKYEINFFSNDFSTLNNSMDQSTLSAIQNISPEFNILEKIQSYMAFLNLDNNTIEELEFIEAKKISEIDQIVKSIELASRNFENNLLQDMDQKIDSNVTINHQTIQIQTKINHLDVFIQAVIKQFQQNYQQFEGLYNFKKDTNNDK
ncbi:tetratricopeptide repeat protein, partial [bacterium]|nr:tetratricopeptide repeat protein [bacterium]